jgi:succinate dehydrogenase/fumarate reductase flavoprotein subunit
MEVRSARHARDSEWSWRRSVLHLLISIAAICGALHARQLLQPQPIATTEHAQPLPCAVVVIGGGLAGLSAAVEAASYFSRENLPSCTVTLLDKEPRIGGNSAKASSGINAACAPLNPTAYFCNTVSGTRPSRRPPKSRIQLKRLRPTRWLREAASASRSCSTPSRRTAHRQGFRCRFCCIHTGITQPQALQFLRSHGVDLSLLSQCGGHSAPRTHRPRTTSSTGIEVIKALTAAAAAVRVRVLNGSRADAIEFCQAVPVPGASRACGVTLSAPAHVSSPPPGSIRAAAVVIATGGFGANNSALAEYAPHAKHLPTTNGAFAQGDGIRLGLAAGGVLRDMQHVQVHPTSFVDPQAPHHAVKWLAPEALRGSGALLLDAACSRFVNELGYRSTVSDAILKFGFDRGGYKAAFMVANARVEQLFTIAGIYKSKGFVVSYPNAQAAAAAMGCEPSSLAKTFTAYAQPHTPDAFGKTVFPATFNADEPLLVMTVTPAVHYTIGGLTIDSHACLMSAARSCIAGVFAAGEVTGGVHGNNRLAGETIHCCSTLVTRLLTPLRKRSSGQCGLWSKSRCCSSSSSSSSCGF